MSHHNTLNTRLLPLSILISSLVSGGAAAGVVPTYSNIKDLSLQTNLTKVPTGPFTRIAEGGSFLITVDSTGDTVQENTLQEKSIFEKLSDYLAAGFITEEQKEKWQENLERLDEKNTALASAQEAANLATKASEKASQDAAKMKELSEAKGKEIVAKEEEIEGLKNTLSTNNEDKKTTIEALALSPDDANIVKQVTDLLASSKEELTAKNSALADKIMELATATEAKKQHDAKIKELDDKLTELGTKLTDAEDNKTAILEKAVTDAEENKTAAENDADSDFAKAKVKHETTKNNLISGNDTEKQEALENKENYERLVKDFDEAIETAKLAVTEKTAEIQQLEHEQSEITDQKDTAQNEKTQIDDNLTDKKNAKDTAKDAKDIAKDALTKAEAADKAIKEAEAAKTTLTAAQAEQQKLTDELESIKADYSTAKTAQEAAALDLTAKTGELDLAQKAVKDLVDNTPATELPTANKTIAQGNPDTVAADTVAIGTKVAGGTQDVAKDGKIIGSIISEDGTVNLAVGAEARNTVVDQGTINNIGGTDHNSVINDGGKLILAGTTTQVPNGDDVINIAKSHNAQINTGGTAEVGANSEIHNLSSTGGAVALKDGAKAFDTIINGGTFTIEKGADAQHTSLTNAHLELIEGATADDTKLANHSTFTLLDGATTTGTLINSDSQFIVNDNATANNTTLNSGEFIVDGTANNSTVAGGKFALNKGATANATILNSGDFIVDGTANNTTVAGGKFAVNKGATADTTTLNSGEFIVDGTANNTTVTGGKFNLMARAQAHKLVVENGSALIAGNLVDAAFNGGTIIFDKAANIGGTVIFDKAANIGGTATFDKAANIDGTINANKDSIINLHEGVKTAKADLILAGKMELIAADIAQTTAKSAGRAAFAGSTGKPAQFAFKNVELAGGSIDMSKSNAQLTMASLAGKGNFKLGSALYNHATAPLNVTGDANGEFDIQIDASGVAPTNLSIVDVKGANTARFALSNGPINLGNYKHNLVSDGKGGFKLVADKTALTPGAAGILAVANTTPTIFNAELSSIQNRLDKQSASANESGVWLTYLNDNYDVKGTATNFKQKLNGMTLGGDKAMELGEAVFSIGAFASHSSSNIKSDYQSSGSVKSNSLGAYAQYLTNSGYYLNGVLKTNQFKQNLNINAKGSNASSNANFSGLGLAVKAGKHITIDELYVSPFAAMSSFTSGKSQYQLSNGMEAQSQGARTTTGTIGMNTGYRFVLNSGAEIKPYAIFSVDHDLMAKNDVMINNELFDNSLKGTRANAGVGVNVNLTSNLSVGSEVKVSKGKNIATPMTINMGVAYTF
ncbi:TPA: autotransporter outer membrane beta-barrel domain-containing protein [Yersinia enterocolitica]|nr:autotransporter outer membrane beta-barrel domain-containing protein [Yersinia enterocolitica]HEN3570712.1 autotransporter outer membrane beta-barrel domain-containing protein [Yersinia enterocolitica]HEN3574741.1 autotransporter outer membrane beta-barrel domain-containing protein [Yersinia enterocolitica]HEN3651172.1 autotransporter outer membrane beta-barrel domain-containing protein [Yersinia enterocolitica]HEN3666586.1 autotransporter outer membrane beta-barrel domain-containing protein